MASKKKSKKPAPKKSAKVSKKSRKKLTKSVTRKKPASAKRPAAKVAKVAKAAAKSPARSPKRPISTRGKREIVESVEFEPKGLGARSAGQSGALQGLSNRESADSESVDELVEEGNAFEAGIVKGVQDADDADEAEVTTHEVLEDDVPREYDDQ